MFQPRTKYVASGQYFISSAAPLILQAILGTCVGVAIYDDKNKIGGLLHLLLPEPISLNPGSTPERYASTGVPLFIKNLLAAGAKKENLKAVIAGGALVGPINEQDLALDIGGQTAEITKKLIKAENIHIVESETGGMFTCSLLLDVNKWEVRIEPSESITLSQPAPGPPAKLDEAGLEAAIEKVLPIPQVALKVLRIIHNDEYETSKIADEVRKDQVLSARTLKICNSAMFGLRHRIESLEDALVLLGRNRFIQMILSAAVKNYFNQSEFGYSICKGGLYHHAVGNAIITEKIAAHSGSVQPSLAYIAGLMHDIGKVVLDQHISRVYPYLYREEQNESADLMVMEKQIIGIDHTEVGSLLGKRWGLPEIFIDTIKNHHYPENAEKNKELIYMVYISDILMSRFQTGLEVETINTTSLMSAMENVGLTISQFPSIVDLVPNQTVGQEAD